MIPVWKKRWLCRVVREIFIATVVLKMLRGNGCCQKSRSRKRSWQVATLGGTERGDSSLFGHKGDVELLPMGQCRSQGSDRNIESKTGALSFHKPVEASYNEPWEGWAAQGVCAPHSQPCPGIQEAKFLIWMHFCSSSSSLSCQILGLPHPKKGGCAIFTVGCQFIGERMAI